MERYQAFCEHDQNRYSLIKYSPLIIAIIMRCHSTVKWLLSLQVAKKFIVDINFIDSYGRTPLVHAIIINDQKIIQSLLEAEILRRTDSQTKLNILKRNVNQLTVFHHLISPFKSGSYYKSEIIYSKLWNMLPKSDKTNELVQELYQFAKEKRAIQLINWMEETLNIGSNKSIHSNNVNENHVLNHQIESDCESFIKSPSLINGNDDYNASLQSTTTINDYRLKRIIEDQTSRIPFDATFTKFDYQNGDYVYNFYRIQLLSFGSQHCLSIRWGMVGTKGNVSKLFYNSKEESIENFKKIFMKKSGEDWDQFSGVYASRDKTNTVDNTMEFSRWNSEDLIRNFISNSSDSRDNINNDFKKIIIKYIKIFHMEIENDHYHSCMNLNTKSIERCLCK
ncbi:hypothetical protein BLA29_004337 [Euroglyphus maynei]|uniref:WGR domain-containing protein n=1 Tax=Euroglyphus maynei TaxID=6958 RepID=A0A1Y3ATK3_EURMA|nr:hypothetical protein BLA29_004337 [Euroglyphus maynei]